MPSATFQSQCHCWADWLLHFCISSASTSCLLNVQVYCGIQYFGGGGGSTRSFINSFWVKLGWKHLSKCCQEDMAQIHSESAHEECDGEIKVHIKLTTIQKQIYKNTACCRNGKKEYFTQFIEQNILQYLGYTYIHIMLYYVTRLMYPCSDQL